MTTYSFLRMWGFAPSGGEFIKAFGGHVMALFGLVFAAILLRFGLLNHRSMDRSPARIWRQVFWMSGSMAVCIGAVVFMAVRAHH